MITLRAATIADCVRVWGWNFAPEVRAQSRTSAQVTLAEHTRWFAARIASEAPIWIIEGDEPLGVIRIDPLEPGSSSGRVSIAIGEHARGRGVGRSALRDACARWARPAFAEIRESNGASRACFEACGFTPHAHEADVITYHWRP